MIARAIGMILFHYFYGYHRGEGGGGGAAALSIYTCLCTLHTGCRQLALQTVAGDRVSMVLERPNSFIHSLTPLVEKHKSTLEVLHAKAQARAPLCWWRTFCV